MSSNFSNIDKLCINTIRFLAVDAIQKANSGHPGAPMGQAPMAFVLWKHFLKHNPRNPKWFNRDRFVLSCGHASMLLYSLLHLTGYDVSIDDIKNFRQWGSITPGHPEFGLTPGVEITTGPLGQGFAHGIGMAFAERFLAAKFNKPNFPIIDHYTYGIVSDGDLEEGISTESASLAGTWNLNKLIYLYDCNHIQIEGDTRAVFTEDIAMKFQALNWNVVGPIDGFDCDAVYNSIKSAQSEKEKPSLIICKTIIGFPSPRQNSEKAHGEPLGQDNIDKTKELENWPLEPAFYIPDEVYNYMHEAVKSGRENEDTWNHLTDEYSNSYHELSNKMVEWINGNIKLSNEIDVLKIIGNPTKIATRVSSGKILNYLADFIENLKSLFPNSDTYPADG